MSDEKKTSLEDLLKSLEGHVVKSVEITRENIRICEGNEGDILHVKISAIEMDQRIGEQTISISKDLTFSILEADLLERILDYYHENLDEINSNFIKINSNLIEISSNLEKSKNTLSRKLLHFVKGTITETFRIRKPVEESDTVQRG